MRLNKEYKEQKYNEFIDYVLSQNVAQFKTQKRMAEDLGITYKVFRGFIKRMQDNGF